MKIKVCGMKYKANIEALSGLELDYMGFIFYPKSKRYVGLDWSLSTLKNLPSHLEKVGVFVNEPISELIATTNKFGIKTIQLHGDESPAYAQELNTLGYSIIKAFAVDKGFNFNITQSYETCCKFFLFDTKSDSYGGTGQTFDWSILNDYNFSTPFFLSGGISLENIQAIKKLTLEQLYAVDLNSKFEIEPGLKNVESVKAFILQIQ